MNTKIYTKNFILIYYTKSEKILNILNTKDSKEKIKLEDIDLLKNNTLLNLTNDENIVKINNEINSIVNLISTFENKLCELYRIIIDEELKNIPLANKLIDEINFLDFNILNRFDFEDKINQFIEMKKLVEVSVTLCNILKTKEEPIEKRLDIEKLRKILNECEAVLHSINSNNFLKTNSLHNIFYYKQINLELEKFNNWIGKFSAFTQLKRSNQSDKIDIPLLKVLIEEAKSVLINLSSEVGIIKDYIDLNQTFAIKAQELINISDNFNNIDAIINSDNNKATLEKIYNEITSNQLPINDKNIIEYIKSLEWATRAVLLLKNQVLPYKTAFRTTQEANSLKHFQEIKKKDYYITLIQQVTMAKNIREIVDILKNNTVHNLGKQLTEDQFNKIVNDFYSKCIIELPDEKSVFENFIRTKNEVDSKYINLINSKPLITEFEKFITEVKKYPIKFDKYILSFENIVTETKLLQKECKKLLDNYKTGKTILTKEKVKNFYEKCKQNKASFTESLEIINLYEKSNENYQKLMISLENKDSDIYDLISLMDSIEVHNSQDEKVIKNKLWIRKYESFVGGSSNLLNYHIIKSLLHEARELNIFNENDDNYDKYNQLQTEVIKAEDMIKRIDKSSSHEELEKIKDEIEKERIDLNEFIIEQETRISLGKPLNLIGNKRKTPDFPTVINIPKYKTQRI